MPIFPAYFHLLFRGFMLYLCYLNVFTYTDIQHDVNIRRCSCRLAITWRVPLVVQELLTLPNHVSSLPVFSGGAQSLLFGVVFCRSFCLFILDIVLSVDLRNLNTSLVSSGGSMSYVVGLSSNSYKPITNTMWVRVRLCKLQKVCTRLTATSDKAYKLLTHGRWFSPPSSTTKTGRHDIAEILLKVGLNTKNQSINLRTFRVMSKM